MVQSKDPAASAKDITEEILENIGSEPEKEMTSGTLIALLHVGPRLPDLWAMEATEGGKRNQNLSLSIVQVCNCINRGSDF